DPVGARHPHPALARAAPQRHANVLEGGGGFGRGRWLATREPLELRKLLERRGCGKRGPRLEGLEWHGFAASAPIALAGRVLCAGVWVLRESTRRRCEFPEPGGGGSGLSKPSERDRRAAPVGE